MFGRTSRRPNRPGTPAPHREDDAGVAVVEFVMISGLLVLLLFGVLQVAAVLYVRSVVAASAADGARYAAAAGIGGAAGGTRADQVKAQALSASLSSGIPCTGREEVDPGSGLRVVDVECTGHIRSIFVPAGLFVDIHVRSRSLDETP
jgi:Flp pilus assembly protein TadG